MRAAGGRDDREEVDTSEDKHLKLTLLSPVRRRVGLPAPCGPEMERSRGKVAEGFLQVAERFHCVGKKVEVMFEFIGRFFPRVSSGSTVCAGS